MAGKKLGRRDVIIRQWNECYAVENLYFFLNSHPGKQKILLTRNVSEFDSTIEFRCRLVWTKYDGRLDYAVQNVLN